MANSRIGRPTLKVKPKISHQNIFAKPRPCGRNSYLRMIVVRSNTQGLLSNGQCHQTFQDTRAGQPKPPSLRCSTCRWGQWWSSRSKPATVGSFEKKKISAAKMGINTLRNGIKHDWSSRSLGNQKRRMWNEPAEIVDLTSKQKFDFVGSMVYNSNR